MKFISRVSRRSALVTALAVALAAALAAPLAAQAADGAWPTQRPIRIVVAYAPGGTTDIVARVVAARLTESLGQSVVVENRSGAGGNIGAEVVASAEPDGYTLQMGTAGNMTINPSIYANMKFDSVRDFAPITLVCQVPNIMVVNKSVPATNVAEFVAWAKNSGTKVNFASSGTGNSPHMTGELFNLAAGVAMTHVPYRGSAPALTDLIAGQGVQVMFDNMPSAIGHVRSGALRALAVTSATRSPAAPDVPTMIESGYKDFVVQGWFGLFAPAKTPAPIVARLHQATVAVLQQPETRRKLEELGAEVVGNSPIEFGNMVRSEIARWARVVREAKVSVQ